MYCIKSNIYNEIIKSIGNAPIESGGILGIKDGIICAFHFDSYSSNKEDFYIPDICHLNQVINEWQSKGISFCGIVHSHPNKHNKPSRLDEEYARLLLDKNKMISYLIFPIVTIFENKVEVVFYEFTENFIPVEVEVKQ